MQYIYKHKLGPIHLCPEVILYGWQNIKSNYCFYYGSLCISHHILISQWYGKIL